MMDQGLGSAGCTCEQLPNIQPTLTTNYTYITSDESGTESNEEALVCSGHLRTHISNTGSPCTEKGSSSPSSFVTLTGPSALSAAIAIKPKQFPKLVKPAQVHSGSNSGSTSPSPLNLHQET